MRPRPVVAITAGLVLLAASGVLLGGPWEYVSRGDLSNRTAAASIGDPVQPAERPYVLSVPSIPQVAAPTLDPAPPGRVTLIGDSLALSATPALADSAFPKFEIHAAQGRQFSAGVEVARELVEAAALGDAVVVALGTNGPIVADDLAALSWLLADVPEVFFVNARVPRPWEDQVNWALGTTAAEMDNARIIDWYSLTGDGAGGERWLAGDGYHLNTDGAQGWADTVIWSIVQADRPGPDGTNAPTGRTSISLR